MVVELEARYNLVREAILDAKYVSHTDASHNSFQRQSSDQLRHHDWWHIPTKGDQCSNDSCNQRCSLDENVLKSDDMDFLLLSQVNSLPLMSQS